MQDLYITSNQLKAARVLLGWSQNDLASASEVSVFTIKRIEASDENIRTIKLSTLQKLVCSLNKHGIKLSKSDREITITYSYTTNTP